LPVLAGDPCIAASSNQMIDLLRTINVDPAG
jgi:hypothetical protein